MEELTYEEFIQNILETRGRFNCGDGYHERHHIIPKCLGGGNEEENLIDLFAKEHFIAHKLLAQENPDNNSLVFAWTCMAFPNNKVQERYEVTPEEYEEAKKAISKAMFGRVVSEETRQKLSEAHKGKNAGENHPFYGKHHTEESKKKMSKNRIYLSGENNPNYGKHLSEQAKQKISESNRKFVLCIETGIIYKSLTKAAEFANVSKAAISHCCRGKCKTVGGYHWCYLYDQTDKDGVIILGAITLGFITEEKILRMLTEPKETER